MDDLDALITLYLNLARSRSTRAGYKTAWNHWLRFVKVLPRTVLWLYVVSRQSSLGIQQSLQLQRYVTYLARKGLRSKTIRSYLNGVKQQHIRRLGVDVVGSYMLPYLLLDGIRQAELDAGIVTQRKCPFTWDSAVLVAKRTNHSNIAESELSTAISTGVGFLLRASELVPCTKTTFHLRRRDVSFSLSPTGTLLSVTIQIKQSKTDRTVVSRTLPHAGSWYSVPNLLYRWMSKTEGLPDSPVFPGLNRKSLSCGIVNWALRLNLHDSGHGFASHSLRRGGATWLINNGASPTCIQIFGRWKSDIWKGLYAQLSFESQIQLGTAFGTLTTASEVTTSVGAVLRC